jgi:hypothetical protein
MPYDRRAGRTAERPEPFSSGANAFVAMDHPLRRTAEKGQRMKRQLWGLLALVPALLLISACDTAFTVGGRTIGIRSGEFIYSDGYLRGNYNFPLAKVWSACEKVVADMKGGDVERIKKIASGNLTAMIQDEKVRIEVNYIEKEITAVAVMAGTGGNNLASQLIHDRITALLKAP